MSKTQKELWITSVNLWINHRKPPYFSVNNNEQVIND